MFNVKPKEIFFTSGGTESNNMIIKSCIEHRLRELLQQKLNMVLNPVLNLSHDKKVELELLNVTMKETQT